MRYDELPQLPDGRHWVMIPEFLDFGQDAVDDLDDDEFVRCCVEFMTMPISEVPVDSPLIRGGSAVAFPDVVNREI